MADAGALPLCTIFLVVGALAAHTLVLVGNLSTASMLHNLGESTNGWSRVGKSFASSLQSEFEPTISNVSFLLTQTIDVVTEIQKSTDTALSLAGVATDSALKEYKTTGGSIEEFKGRLLQSLRKITSGLFHQLDPLIDQFVATLRPVLDQVRTWTGSFTTKMQSTIEEFAATLDHAQKLFDQVMSQVNAGPASASNETYMIYNTYTLFDTDNSGTIRVSDLQSAAQLFGVSALSGNKVQELFAKYDVNKKGGIDQQEYSLFVHDPSLPGIMPLVLRTYSRALAQISGKLAAARMRDEVAIAVVNYLELVSSKNLTRIGWIAHALTNGSVPVQFTADILRELAVATKSPSKLSVVDVGAVVVAEMARMNAELLVKATRLLSDPGFWVSEGFPREEQGDVIATIANWTAHTPQGYAMLARSWPDMQQTAKPGEPLADAARRLAMERQSRYETVNVIDQSIDEGAKYVSAASLYLREHLLGGGGAAAAGKNPEADAISRRGRPAALATLEFAMWLANNASDTSHTHIQACFDYTGSSSGAMDNIAMQVNGMVAKILGFLSTLGTYSTPAGQDRLINKTLSFTREAAEDVVLICEDYVDAQLKEIECQMSGDVCNKTAIEKDLAIDMNGAFNFVTKTIYDMKGALPPIIKDLKFAKAGVSTVSKAMDVVMVVMGAKAPPLFYSFAANYRTMWIIYFILFSVLSIGVLFYGFWASGYFTGQASIVRSDEDYETPRGMLARLNTCFESCSSCLKGCHSHHIMFWSFLLLAELIVLVLFLISVVICCIAGVQMFVSSGCSQVYILGDKTVCTTALNGIQGFLKTFMDSSFAAVPITETCSHESLLTCRLIKQEVGSSMIISIIGGLVASTLSFWMLLESAIMHERARYHRYLKNDAKED